MTHYRTALRRAAKDLLMADEFFAEANAVLASARVDPDSLPCWSVSAPSEDREDLNRSQFRFETNLVVALTVSAAADAIEDDLDGHSEKIETLIIDGLSENTGVQGVELKRTEIKSGPEDKLVTGSVMMLFVVTGFIKIT